MHLIFDFDGTIADSFKVNISIFCQMTGRSPDLPRAEIERLRQLQTRQILKELGISLWQIPGLLKQGRAEMHRRIGEVRPFATISPTLKELQSQGHKLYILSTNSRQNIETFLQKHNLQHLFSEICGGIGLFGKRPAIKTILRRNNILPSDCFYIGDETRDIKAGTKAGIRTIAVAWGYMDERALAPTHPYALIRKPSELLTVCRPTQ
ncbi:MAG TPA: HAD-IA family hydrolase [Candidatus Saccharimonadales bacterium]|nr:HAD-IA family hydrolase [Candidatus Saccharimonadales bacterium]